jgi:hypothetical protein
MNGIGNGVTVAVEALQDDLDVVNVLQRPPWKPRGRVE